MTYNVNIEEKKIKRQNNNQEYCNIYAQKQGTISRIITEKGVEKVEVNDIVKEGDILISGDIIYNEETKDKICAKGTVYAYTWYKINISIPKNKIVKIPTGKQRNNIKIKYNNKKINLLKSRTKKHLEKDKKITNLFGIEIYLTKEIEIKEKKEIIPYKDQEEYINNLINNKLKHELKKDYQIIKRKVLKKNDNNSKIDMEVFIVAEEIISISK